MGKSKKGAMQRRNGSCFRILEIGLRMEKVTVLTNGENMVEGFGYNKRGSANSYTSRRLQWTGREVHILQQDFCKGVAAKYTLSDYRH